MLLLMATTPVTLCACDRSFNRLIIIKTYLPSIMSEDQLNRLSLYIYIYIKIEIYIEIDCDYIISKFEIRNPRIMQLINILD